MGIDVHRAVAARMTKNTTLYTSNEHKIHTSTCRDLAFLVSSQLDEDRATIPHLCAFAVLHCWETCKAVVGAELWISLSVENQRDIPYSHDYRVYSILSSIAAWGTAGCDKMNNHPGHRMRLQNTRPQDLRG
jgi:hypothetical protein